MGFALGFAGLRLCLIWLGWPRVVRALAGMSFDVLALFGWLGFVWLGLGLLF